MNLATRQARVVTSAHITPTDLTRAVGAAGFPARTLWDTIREDTRVVLDVQGLKVLHTMPIDYLCGMPIWSFRGESKGRMITVNSAVTSRNPFQLFFENVFQLFIVLRLTGLSCAVFWSIRPSLLDRRSHCQPAAWFHDGTGGTSPLYICIIFTVGCVAKHVLRASGYNL